MSAILAQTTRHAVVLVACLLLGASCGSESDAPPSASGTAPAGTGQPPESGTASGSGTANTGSRGSSPQPEGDLPTSLGIDKSTAPDLSGLDVNAVLPPEGLLAHVPNELPGFRTVVRKASANDGEPASSTVSARYASFPAGTVYLTVRDTQGAGTIGTQLKYFAVGSKDLDSEYVVGDEVHRLHGDAKWRVIEKTSRPRENEADPKGERRLDVGNGRMEIEVLYRAPRGSAALPSFDVLWSLINDTHIAELLTLPVAEPVIREEPTAVTLRAEDLLPDADVARIGGHTSVAGEHASFAPANTINHTYRLADHIALIFMATPAPARLVDSESFREIPGATVRDLPDLGTNGFAAEFFRKVTKSDGFVVSFHMNGYLVELKSVRQGKTFPRVINSLDKLIEVARVVAANLAKTGD